MSKLSVIQKQYPDGITNEAELNLIKSGINPWVARSLVLRNVIDPDIAKGNYRIKPFHILKDMSNLARNLANAIENEDKIVIVADYDCDGATSCAIGLTGLKAMGANIDFIVPNRFKHGYGLSPSVVDLVIPMKAKWILTVDNGISCQEGVDYANSKGIKVLITDHHLPAKNKPNPNAVALVNPNQEGDTSGLNNMAGCGVIYYTLAAVREELLSRKYFKDNVGPNLADWLDLVALGTVADVVKLDDNNRWLVKQGLRRIRAGKVRPGIKALFDIAGKDTNNAISQDFGFAIGPRINAAGRLEDMTIGIRCLIADNYKEASILAMELDDLNTRRKNIENEMKEFAWETIDLEGQKDRMTKVVYGHDFHEGVIGIVAGRIKETTDCPTIVFAPAEGEENEQGEPTLIKGSGRSVPTLHLRDALDLVFKNKPYIFKAFGGHAMAAGLTIYKKHLEEFKDEFDNAVKTLLNNEPYKKILEIDGDLLATDISVRTAEILNNEVWGQGFPEPLWASYFKVLDARLIGKDENHVKLLLEKDNHRWDAIQFFNTDLPQVGQQIHVAYRIGINEFNNKIMAQIMIVDKTV
ncbi:TPA: single-stranded-DNA-specific exonuclease RecJ [Escherichia coli]|nr:single-stranded-DNA-specific exonuclease RecJ [Escherichia coli]